MPAPGVDEFLEVPQGRVHLLRHPVRPRDTLRAWDAADEYVLEHLAQSPQAERLARPGAEVVVVNDESGAITAALAVAYPACSLTHVSDSLVSQLALRANLARNGVDSHRVTALSGHDEWPSTIAIAVVKVPKALALLDEQLRRLRGHLLPDAVVVGAAMTRHVHLSTIECFERHIGPTPTSLAQRKARLLLAEVGAAQPAAVLPWPVQWQVPATGLTVVGYANAFAAEAIDPGTALLLEHLDASLPEATVVDIGCGTGVLGLTIAIGNPDVQVVCIDESFDAVASASASWEATCSHLGLGHRAGQVVCMVCDGLPTSTTARGSVDRVVMNPPFHIGHALSDATAWDWFVQARHALRSGGDVWVVGNRHLAYHVKLKRVFGNCTVVAGNPNFVVLRSERD